MLDKLLFLDSASLDDVRQISGTKAIPGVTTNPSLMSKESKGDYNTKLVEIIKELHNRPFVKLIRHLSVEVLTSDPNKMYDEACLLFESLYHLSEVKKTEFELCIKIPLLFETLPVITKLHLSNIPVNATAIMTWDQAKLAYDAGARYISFFYNRMKDEGLDALGEIERFVELVKPVHSHIICGSIRQPMDVYDCWNAGADIVTTKLDIIKLLAKHTGTDKAVQKFQEDIDAWLK